MRRSLLCALALAACNDTPDGGGPVLPPPCAPPGARLAHRRTLDAPGLPMALAWSPDSRTLAVGGHFRDPMTSMRYDTKLYDAASGALAKSFDCHNYWAISVAWSGATPAGPLVGSGSFGHAVQLWNPDGPGSTLCPQNPPPSVTAMKADGLVAVLPEVNGATTGLAFSPDGRWLAGVNRDPALRLWQLEAGPDQFQVVSLWYQNDAGNYLSVDWSPDGRRLVTSDSQLGRVAAWAFDPVADHWDAATIADFARLDFSQQEMWMNRNAALTARMPLWESAGHQRVWNARYSPDGLRVAAATAGGELLVLDAATGAEVYAVRPPRTTALEGLSISPDGSRIAVGGSDHVVYVFAAGDGHLEEELTGHADVVSAVAWSPDGCTLASAGGGTRISPSNHMNDTGPDRTVRLWTY